MYTPMVGGAERLLRDLLFGINREQFDVSLFYDSWPDFDSFLNLDTCPSIQIYAVPVLEISGHTSALGNSRSTIVIKRYSNLHNLIINTLTYIKPFYRKFIPFRRITTKLLDLLLCSLFITPNIFCLYRALKNKKLDILHIINGGYPGALSSREIAWVSKRLKIPVTVMTVCATPVKRKFPQFIEKIMDGIVNKCIDKFIIPADLVGRYLTKYREIDSSKFCKIPWGVTASKTNYENSSITKIRRQLKIPENAKIIGTVARFSQLKGHRYLINACAILKNNLHNFHAILVGEGPDRTEMENKVKLLGLKNFVSFTGYVSNLVEVVQAFDIFVLSSITEGIPYSILEAMSMGKPVVATAVGGVPEVIKNDESGILVPPRDSLKLAQAIEQLLTNPEIAQKMGKAGFVRYKINYTIEKMIKQNEILYHELIHKNG